MNKKTILLITLLVALAGGGYAWSEYNREKISSAEAEAKEQVSAEDLLKAFTADESTANARFVGTTEQVIEVSGTIRGMEPVGNEMTNVVLETGNDLAAVVCEFANKDLHPDWRSGAQVKVKGVCTGILMDVVLVRCAAVE